MNMVDMHSRLLSALLIVALMMAADTNPVMRPGAYLLVTAIIAVLPATPGSSSFSAKAASPSKVGKTAISAMSTPESRDAFMAVFSSLALSKRLTISGPERKVQK